MIHKHHLIISDQNKKKANPHHAQALGGSVLNSPKNLPKPAHASCQVAVATWWGNRKENTLVRVCSLRMCESNTSENRHIWKHFQVSNYTWIFNSIAHRCFFAPRHCQFSRWHRNIMLHHVASLLIHECLMSFMFVYIFFFDISCSTRHSLAASNESFLRFLWSEIM